MRNIFDQYDQPENRLTHALASCLAEDGQLVRRFLRDFLGLDDVPRSRLRVIEQSLPGDPGEPMEEDAARQGLPDAAIHDGESWCVLIEAKAQARATVGQLRRHFSSVRRRGFKRIHVVLLTATDGPARLPEFAMARRWEDLYVWFAKQRDRSPWAGRLTDYLEIMEAKMVEKGYLVEGALTTFAGFPFSAEHPYTYLEGKRLLRLAIEELRTSTRLRKELGMNPKAPARSAITEGRAASVWDFIPLKIAGEGESFTKSPHLTLIIQRERVIAGVTIPNRIKAVYRRPLVTLGEDGFLELVKRIGRNLRPVLRQAPGSSPRMFAVQRHFRTQRSVPIEDASLEFDLRTAITGPKDVKRQPEWLEAAYGVLARKHSNYQVMIGVAFPFDGCKAIGDARAIALIEEPWLGLKPLLASMGVSRGN